MTRIGKPIRKIEAWPIENPVPKEVPLKEPVPEKPVPKKEPIEVPA